MVSLYTLNFNISCRSREAVCKCRWGLTAVEPLLLYLVSTSCNRCPGTALGLFSSLIRKGNPVTLQFLDIH